MKKRMDRNYKDWDDPESKDANHAAITKSVVNYHDI